MTEGEEEVPAGEMANETIEIEQSQQTVQGIQVIEPQLTTVGQPMQHATVVTTTGHHFQPEILKGEEIHIPINGDNIAINELAKKGYQIRIASNGKESLEPQGGAIELLFSSTNSTSPTTNHFHKIYPNEN